MEQIVNLYRAKQVAELDRRAIQDHGIPGFTLMQRAAAAAYALLCRRWPQAERIAVLAGPGNNGGDAVELARLAQADGRLLGLHLAADPARLSGEAAESFAAFEGAGGQLSRPDWHRADVIVDGLLGTGLSRAVSDEFRELIAAVNAAGDDGAGVLALDIPSGIAADTGAVMGGAVQADVCISFIGRKLGLSLGAGLDHAGMQEFSDLSVPAAVFADCEPPLRALNTLPRPLLPHRRRNSHKGVHGHVLCIGGRPGFGGAVRMAASATLRCGAGLASIACHPESAIAAASQAEIMVRGIHHPGELDHMIERATVVAVGPGLGTDDWSQALLQRALAAGLPLVLDADALNLLAPLDVELPERCVITPHPGEAGRLLGCGGAEIQADRLAALEALVDRSGACVVLKGAGSLIGGPGRKPWLCLHGNPGMAVGGMGDVLTGVIAALLAQGLEPFEAAHLGVEVHARAGDDAAAGAPRGLLASDLLMPLRARVNA